MNKQNDNSELTDVDSIDALNNVYQQMQKEVPSIELDRQIIAAAYREIQQPKKRKIAEKKWWQKISLPLYVAATFAFTIVTTHWFWPASTGKMLPGTSPGPVTFETANDTTASISPPERKALIIPERKQILLPPKEKTIPELDSNDATVSGFGEFEALNIENIPLEKMLIKTPQTNQKDKPSTGKVGSTNVARLQVPTAETWAREILNLYKSGEYESGKQALIKFKKVYPEYPIDEQLKVFK
ncbi:hypothetical protein [Aliikangiella maris]|uniref:Tetratricopeptide repeat protein n=2 Tax=Aliikangiella maris TaxID=3162458 RepID=A0ABV3MT24_9GAMM